MGSVAKKRCLQRPVDYILSIELLLNLTPQINLIAWAVVREGLDTRMSSLILTALKKHGYCEAVLVCSLK